MTDAGAMFKGAGNLTVTLVLSEPLPTWVDQFCLKVQNRSSATLLCGLSIFLATMNPSLVGSNDQQQTDFAANRVSHSSEDPVFPGILEEPYCDQSHLNNQMLPDDFRDHYTGPNLFSGNREPLIPNRSTKINFPADCFGFYGFERSLAQTQRIDLHFQFEKAHTGPNYIEVLITDLQIIGRRRSEGPRIGLTYLSGIADIGSALDARFLNGELEPTYSDLLIPTPHYYGVSSGRQILEFNIMGHQFLNHEIDWKRNPTGSLEWNHFLHRFHFLRELMADEVRSDSIHTLNETNEQALCDPTSKSAVKSVKNTECRRTNKWIENVIRSWIIAYPTPVGSNGGAGPAWETLSAAWRLREWLLVIKYRWSEFGEGFKSLILRSIWEHARHLRDHTGHPNNWLMVEASALALAGLYFPEFIEAEEWIDIGITRLREQSRRQFFTDGAHFELSPLYHSICLHALVAVIDALQEREREVPSDLARIAKKAAFFLASLKRPDGLWPSINDSGFSGSDYSKVLIYASGILGNVGKNETLELSNLNKPSCGAPHTSIFSDSGFVVMRSGAKNEHQLFFRTGSAGAAHCHDDALSVEITTDEIPRIIDPGISRYQPDGFASYYRSALAHNNILINGAGASRSSAPYSKRTARADRITHLSNGSFTFISAQFNGKWQAASDVAVTRSILSVNSKFWIIEDVISGSDLSECAFCMQFADSSVQLASDTLWLTIGGRDTEFLIAPLILSPLTADIDIGSTSPMRGWIAINNGDYPAPHCMYKIVGPGPVLVHWVMAPTKFQKIGKIESVVNSNTIESINVEFQTNVFFKALVPLRRNVDNTSSMSSFNDVT